MTTSTPAVDAGARGKVEYVIFDMDGLLIDSERVYTQVTNDILAEYGHTMTWDIKAGLMGKPERAAAQHLLDSLPDLAPHLTIDTYLTRRDALQDQIWPLIPLLPGVRRLVTHLARHNVPIAVATGSRRNKFALKSSGAAVRDVFACFGERVVCGDDVVPDEGAPGTGATRRMGGKPDPEIFLVAARERLGRRADAEDVARGLVFEDAIPGVRAGKRAGMHVVWIPDPNLLNVPFDGSEAERADQVLRSMEEFVPEEWGLPPYDDGAVNFGQKSVGLI